MSYHASNSGQVWKGKSRWIPHLANPFHAGEGAQQPQHTSADEGAYHSDFDGNFGPAVYNMPPLRSLYTSGQTGEPSSSRRMPAYGGAYGGRHGESSISQRMPVYVDACGGSHGERTPEHIGPAGIEGFQQSSLAFRQGMHGKKHYPRIHFFGLNFNHLPPLVTAPSLQNPVAPPLALSLGIDIDWSSGNPAVTFHLIHIERQNGFPPNRQQLFLNLSCPDSKGLPCPSLKYNPHDLHFLAPSSQMISPLQIEALAKLEAEVLVVRTGAVLPNGAQEYRVLCDMDKLSKRCSHCGRWEALVRRKGVHTGSMRETHKYRRWGKCGSCRVAWFCRYECLYNAWTHGRHCLVCFVARKTLKL